MPAFAQAQSLQDVAAKQEAVVAAWEKTPLTVRRAIFVAEKPAAYGAFDERPSNVFKTGETLHTYAEPVGYLWKVVDADTYRFGLVVDFEVLSPAGDVLTGKEGFLHYSQDSHYKNQELMLNLSLDLTGASPGKYILKYTLHDANSDKVTSFQQPFEIAN